MPSPARANLAASAFPASTTPRARLGAPIAFALATIVLTCGLCMLGEPNSALAAAGVFTGVANIVQGGLYALVYLLAAVGLGRPLAACCARGRPSALWVQAALGVAVMLWLSHLLGVVGLLSGDGLLPRLVAWGVVIAGLVMLLDQMVRGELAPEQWPVVPWPGVLMALPAAIALAAAASPPGWLWDSEFGGYDALSYHLQLPKEWAAGSALAPSDHNVYSFLPGYVEAAYLHLGQLMLGGFGGGGGGGGGAAVERMLGGDGVWVYACQLLHTLLGALAALLCGRGAWAAARSAGTPDHAARSIGIATSLLAFGTGWTMVCASLAYNEMGVLLLAAGALLLCIERSEIAPSPWMLGAGVGFMVGVASSCKPTALLLIGPCAGLVMLAALPRRAWTPAIIGGAMAGLAAIAPWLVRNALAAGNPVFPFGAEWLGSGHWSAEQVARYARAHAFDGSIIDRFTTLFSARGWLNEQWGATPWIVLGAAVLALTRGPRVQAMVLAAGIALGILAWMFFTHLQSRFLLPLLAPMCVLLGAGAAELVAGCGEAGARRWGTAFVAIGFVPALLAAIGFAQQRDGQPNATLISGVGGFTGLSRAEAMLALPTAAARAQRLRETAGPFELVNLAIQPGVLGFDTRAAMLGLQQDFAPGEPSRVYLLGDATPLYYLGATGGSRPPVEYHTTWDRSPLGPAIRKHPSEPAAWSRELRAGGIGFVLVNLDELARLIAKDGNFDPDVTIERVREWMIDPRNGCTRVWQWGYPTDESSGGQWLLRLVEPARAGAGAP